MGSIVAQSLCLEDLHWIRCPVYSRFYDEMKDILPGIGLRPAIAGNSIQWRVNAYARYMPGIYSSVLRPIGYGLMPLIGFSAFNGLNAGHVGVIWVL